MIDGLVEGRMVHFVTSEREGARHCAAIVAGVKDAERGSVNLAVFTPSGQTYSVLEVEYSEQPRPRSWHWVEGGRPFTLAQLQAEQRPWVLHNFGGGRPWMPLLGAVEELGEAAHAFLKMEQGIRGSREEHMAKLADAIGDTVIFLSDLCSELGLDYQAIVERTWAEVKRRDWRANPNGADLEAAAR